MNEKPYIIDFHTHAFPDSLAARAMQTLHAEAPQVKSYLNGTLGDLRKSMRQNGISLSVVACIATNPSQFQPIFDWCIEQRCDDLAFFPSVHPKDKQCVSQIERIANAGFKGIKMHPFYQDFYALEDSLMPIYEAAQSHNLLLVMHTGYDIAFPLQRRADAQAILTITESFPKLKFVATHFGAWQQWDEVEKMLIGKEIYMEISWSLELLETEQARRMILNHPDGFILFGTDSPWTDQKQTINLLRKLQLPVIKEEAILGHNASALLKK